MTSYCSDGIWGLAATKNTSKRRRGEVTLKSREAALLILTALAALDPAYVRSLAIHFCLSFASTAEIRRVMRKGQGRESDWSLYLSV